MKHRIIFATLIALGLNGPLWAYGSSSSSKACTKPKFSEFDPPEKAEVSPGSKFSFVASKATYPNSIEVSAKKQAVVVKVSETGAGYTVTGTLPPSLKGTYARISITGEASGKCRGSDGWLIKIKE